MRTLLPLLALLALAACADSDNPREDCKSQAYDDPTYKAWILARMDNAAYNVTYAADSRVAYRMALQRCLQAHGLAPQGGVEPVMPQH